MNSIFKSLSLALINAMMIMTFILSPIPFSGNSNIAYAADEASQASDGDADDLVSTEEGCDEGSTDDKGNKRYKAGCEFNEDLAKSSLKNHYPEGIKGIIEQFAGAVFALIGISLISNPIPSAVLECPQQIGAKVTFPIIQGSALTYLIGEISANLKFKEASKIAVDKTFDAKKDESYNRKAKNKEEREKSREESKKNIDSNNKQIAAYDNLSDIYKKQVEGLKKKVQFSTAAEIGIITAEVFEITDYVSIEAEGTALVEAASANSIAAIAELNAMAAPLAVQEAAACATSWAGSATVCASCGKAILDLVKYTGILELWDSSKLAEAEALKAKKLTETQIQSTSVTSSMAAVGVCAFSGGCVPVEGVAAAELAADVTIGTTIDGMSLTAKTNRTPFITELEVSAAGCIGAGTAVMPLVVANEAFRAVPIVCSGVQTEKGADWDTPLPLYSYKSQKMDENTLLKAVTDFNSIKTDPKLKYVKVLLHNMFQRIAMLKIEQKEFKKPSKEISAIAASSGYADYLLEETMKKIDSTDFNLEYEKINTKYNGSNLALVNDFGNILSDFKLQMIQSAEANSFKELLNVGVKVLLLYFVMNSWLRNNAFPKPLNRLITWGIMAVVFGAIISFDMKSKSEAEDRLARVAKEKEAFLNSHALKTLVTKGNDVTGGEGAKVTLENSSQQNGGGSGIVACAVPKGDSFAPTVCPVVVPRSRFNINTNGANFASNGSLLGNSLKSIGDVGYGAATGQTFSNPTLMEASLSSLSSKRDSLIKKRDALRAKYDKKPAMIDKNGNKIEKASLGAISSKFKKLYRGDSGVTGVSSQQLSGNSKLFLPKLNELKKKENKVSSRHIPTFKMPTAQKNDFDFDLGGEGGTTIDDEGKTANTGKAEEDLSQFVVNSGEINEDENVNIFKLISNRYLRSYPTLLNEKKKRVKGTK
jgi:hypothetical protein